MKALRVNYISEFRPALNIPEHSKCVSCITKRFPVCEIASQRWNTFFTGPKVHLGNNNWKIDKLTQGSHADIWFGGVTCIIMPFGRILRNEPTTSTAIWPRNIGFTLTNSPVLIVNQWLILPIVITYKHMLKNKVSFIAVHIITMPCKKLLATSIGLFYKTRRKCESIYASCLR